MRFLSAISLVLLSCSACSSSSLMPDRSSRDYIHLVLTSTNDFAGHLAAETKDIDGQKIQIGGAPLLSAYLKTLEKSHEDRFAHFDAGGFLHGSLESKMDKGKSVIKVMNQLPITAAAIGSHEFDYGPLYRSGNSLGVIKKRINDAEFPILGANIIDKNGEPLKWTNVFNSNISTLEGIRIGVIGLVNPLTSHETQPEYVNSLEFLDPALILEKHALSLRRAGAKLIVLLASIEGMQEDGALRSLLERVSDNSVDVVFASGGNKDVAEKFRDTIVLQSRGKGRYLNRVDLYFKSKDKEFVASLSQFKQAIGICSHWFEGTKNCDYESDANRNKNLKAVVYEKKPITADAEISKIVAPILRKAKRYRRQRVGAAAREISFIANNDSELGNLFTKALASKFPKVDAVVLSGADFMGKLNKGVIKRGDLFDVYPYERKPAIVRVRGDELKTILAVSSSGAQPMPVLRGLKLNLKESAYVTNDLNDDDRIDDWERSRLLEIAWEDGAEVEDDKEYKILVTDHWAAGGEYQSINFDRIPRNRIRVLKAKNIRDLVIDYIRRQRLALNTTGFPLLRESRKRIFWIP